MTDNSRLDKIEEHVPEDCIRHDEQIKQMCRFAEEIRDTVKWALKTTVGAVIVALISTMVGILVTSAIARCVSK